MSKITFSDIQSTEDLTELNQNFTDIEQEFQNNIFYRDNPEGEPNHMEQDLDMNSNRILNLPAPLNNSEAARLVDVQNSVAGGSANLITYEDTNVKVALDNRVIRVQSRTEMKGYDVPAGYQFSLEEGGRSGVFVVKSGTPPSDPQEGVYVVLNNGNYAERIGFESLPVEAFGAKHSDVAFDNFASIKAALESGYPIEFAQAKTYTCLTTGEITADEIQLIGNGATIAFEPSLPKGLHLKGQVIGTTTLSADASLFDQSLSVTSATGIDESVFLVVRDTADGSYSGYRAEYRNGDICRVRDVSGTTVTLNGDLQKFIPAVTSEVAIVRPVKLTGGGLTITKTGSGVGQAVWLDYLWDSKIESIRGVNGAVSIRAKHLLDSEIHNCSADNTVAFSGAETDGYGISYLNCKNVTDYDGRYETVNNHAADTSGGVEYSVPSNNVVFKRAVLLGGQWAASNHGDSTDCRFVNCVADGVILGGERPAFVDGVVLFNIGKYSARGLSTLTAVRLTEMLRSGFDLTGNTVIMSNDNKDPASILHFVQTISSNMIGASTIGGGIINVSGNRFRYVGSRDCNTEGDFIGLQIGVSTSATAAVKAQTDIVKKDNEFDYSTGTFITHYQLTEFSSASIKSNKIISDESDIRRRLITSFVGDVDTDEKMAGTAFQEVGQLQTLIQDVETTLYESAGTEASFEVLGGVLTGLRVAIKCYSDGELVYNGGQFNPAGDDSSGDDVSVYYIPRITGSKSVKVTATAFLANRVCGWSIAHKT